MITQRQIEIYDLILSSNQFVTMEELLEITKMSERTIRYDISNLRTILSEFDIELRFAPTNGFYIPINQRVLAEAKFLELKGELSGIKPVQIETQIYEELLLLFSTSRYLSVEEITSTLFISERSVADYLSGFEAYYRNTFKIKNKRCKGYYLEGSEFDLRCLVAAIIVPFIKNRNTPEDWYHHLPVPIRACISINRLTIISKNYKRFNAKYQVWLNSEKFFNILCYLIVRHYRLARFLTLETTPRRYNGHKGESLLEYASGILQSQEDTDCDFEMDSMLELLRVSDVFINDQVIDEPKINMMLGEMMMYLEEQASYFNLEHLHEDLILHFQTLINRKAIHSNEEEKMILDEIKNKYKQYFELAQTLSMIFEKHFQRTLSETEVSYIAIYLYKNRIETHGQKKVIVVCSTGRGLSTLLVTRIKHVFPQLEVVAQMSFYQLESLRLLEDIDFVISTIPIEQSIYPVLQISNILSSNDIAKIHHFINDDMSAKVLKRYSMTNYFDDIKDKLPREKSELIQMYSQIISEVTLSLIELTTEISDQYPMSYDSILGLTIHLVMAIPRWFETKEIEDEFAVNRMYEYIELSHPDLVKTLNAFFSTIEDSLYISISNEERLAFYQYILRRKNDE